MSFVVSPTSVDEAIAFLVDNPEARPMSGGASLVAMKNARLIEASHFVSLARIDSLRGIRRNADGSVTIGGMVPHRDTAACDLLDGDLRMIRQAAGQIANRVVRNMGTIGGAVANADPAADYLPVLVCADAQVEITGPGGKRLLPIRDYLVDWYETALEPAEIVTGIALPPAGSGPSVYRKLARTPGDFATVSVACARDGDGVRVAVGACGPAPLRAPEAERALAGQLDDPAAVAAFCEALVALADPVDDVRGSAEYRLTLIPRMVAAAIRDVTGGL
ncbi:MAG: xanthine dehydrogenase family protein subunit M [Rhodobacter sp.]|nr:xanthine dehydrogenase family protein subunit M [Paracoccaceae bacterium]MCC0076249.1 xanthine dehydrogenase family protein subunit M [Rhodobacter sp.]